LFLWFRFLLSFLGVVIKGITYHIHCWLLTVDITDLLLIVRNCHIIESLWLTSDLETLVVTIISINDIGIRLEAVINRGWCRMAVVLALSVDVVIHLACLVNICSWLLGVYSIRSIPAVEGVIRRRELWLHLFRTETTALVLDNEIVRDEFTFINLRIVDKVHLILFAFDEIVALLIFKVIDGESLFRLDIVKLSFSENSLMIRIEFFLWNKAFFEVIFIIKLK